MILDGGGGCDQEKLQPDGTIQGEEEREERGKWVGALPV